MPDANPPATAQRQDWSRFIVKHTPGAVITTDPRGRITEFNPAAEKLTGYRRQEAIGQPAEEILNCQGVEPGCPLDQVVSGKLEFTQELVLHNRSGEAVPVMVSSFALQDEGKALLGAAIIIRDLNLIKRLETERRQLVNMFAHDLKTPVVGMAGLIRRLLQGKVGSLSQEQTTYLETIDREMTRLEKLITSFLEFARLDLRIMTPQPEALQVQDECREVVTPWRKPRVLSWKPAFLQNSRLCGWIPSYSGGSWKISWATPSSSVHPTAQSSLKSGKKTARCALP
jgi:two-component system phosphate regulon sensor histidine kinase PhoR